MMLLHMLLLFALFALSKATNMDDNNNADDENWSSAYENHPATFIKAVESFGKQQDLSLASRSLQTAFRLINDQPVQQQLAKEELAFQLSYAKSLKIELGIRTSNQTLNNNVHPQMAVGNLARAWFSIRLRAGDMKDIEELKWNEGDCLFTVAKHFCKRFKLDEETILKPLYDAMANLEDEKLKRPKRTAPIPPWDIPVETKRNFTMNGRIRVMKHYRDDAGVVGTERRLYSRLEIERYITAAILKQAGYYGSTDTHLFNAISEFGLLKGKSVVIMGSLQPWYEAICVASEAKQCTTVEYHRLYYQHPKMTTLTIEEFNKQMEDGRGELYDEALSISSFEHDGLGRYGDPIDPDGDIKIMQFMNKVVKPGGIMVLAVPCGRDKLVWNLHRVYGIVRLPLLLQHWTVLKTFGLPRGLLSMDPIQHAQPIFVLKNEKPTSPYSLPY